MGTVKRLSPSPVPDGNDSDGGKEGFGASGSSSGGDSEMEGYTVGEEDEEDLDAPRVAQWEDEDELDEEAEDDLKPRGESPNLVKSLQSHRCFTPLICTFT